MADFNLQNMVAAGAKAAGASLKDSLEEERKMRMLEMAQRFQTAERVASQEFQAGQQQKQFGQQTSERIGGQEFLKGQQTSLFAHQSEESSLDRGSREKIAGMQVGESRLAHAETARANLAKEQLDREKFQHEKEKPTAVSYGAMLVDRSGNVLAQNEKNIYDRGIAGDVNALTKLEKQLQGNLMVEVDEDRKAAILKRLKDVQDAISGMVSEKSPAGASGPASAQGMGISGNPGRGRSLVDSLVGGKK